MKTKGKGQVGAQTWLFVEYAKAGRQEKLFHGAFCMPWLRYMEAQGIIGLTHTDVGLLPNTGSGRSLLVSVT